MDYSITFLKMINKEKIKQFGIMFVVVTIMNAVFFWSIKYFNNFWIGLGIMAFVFTIILERFVIGGEK